MSYKVSDKAILRGRIRIGEGSVVEDNVTLGNSDDGELTIGDDAFIRSGTVIYSGVRIGKSFRTGHNVLIRENTGIGDNVLVGTNSVIDGDCRIGNNVSIQTGVYITRYTTIEDGVFMGPCSVTTNDKYMLYGAELKGPVIREGAKIGANSTILPGIVIGRNSTIGSGAVVTQDVDDNDIAFGNPARVMGKGQDA